MDNFAKAIAVGLAHEGGFVNNPSDPGGATNYGISLYWLKHQCELDHDLELAADINHDGRIDIADIRALTPATAAAYYRAQWWDRYRYGNLVDDDVAAKVFDTAINMGGIQAHKLLQRALAACGTVCLTDGVLGPKTLAAINAADPVQLLAKFRQLLADFYQALVARKPSFSVFLAGWLRRAES